MIKLIQEYQSSLIFTESQLKQKQKQIRFYQKKQLSETGQKHLNMLQHDERILNAAVTTLNFSIEWLATGRQPGAMRGIDRRATYEREIKSDRKEIYFKSYDKYELEEKSEDELVADSYKSQIVKEVVSSLTKRQKELLELHALKFSTSEIGVMLGISKQAVWETIETCKEKIKNEGWFMG